MSSYQEYRLAKQLRGKQWEQGDLCQIGSNRGTIRIWLEETVTDNERASKLNVQPPDPIRWSQQRSLMQVYDNLVANRDSNLGNLLICSANAGCRISRKDKHI